MRAYSQMQSIVEYQVPRGKTRQTVTRTLNVVAALDDVFTGANATPKASNKITESAGLR